MGVGINGGYHTPDLYVYCPNHSGMGFGPIAVDFVGFRLQGLINELTYGITTGYVWSAIQSFIGSCVDIEPPVFAGGRFVVTNSSSTSASNGSTFNPFTYYSGSTVTCTDSPTAGPKKGKTVPIPLDWRNFEFRDGLPGGATNALVAHATVFNTLTNTPVYTFNTPLTNTGHNETNYSGGYPSGTTLGGFHVTFNEPQGLYVKFQMGSTGGHYGRLININLMNSSFGTEATLELMHAEDFSDFGNRFMFQAISYKDSNGTQKLRVVSPTGDLEHGQDYEVYVTWNALSAASGANKPERYDLTIAHRKVGGDWVIDTSPPLSDVTNTPDNLVMFDSSLVSGSNPDGTTASYFRRSTSALCFGIWNWDGQSSSTTGNGTLKEVKLFNDYISGPDFFDNQHWQPTSTWASTGTRYLRYMATDENGNETPNNMDHYLTITVS